MEEPVYMDIDATQELAVDPLPFARSYQLEALEKAINQNTIVFLETGSGKTLIAIMLLRTYAYMLRKPSPFIAVFLVPQVVLVKQQADAVAMHTDLNVGTYWGDMGIDFWDAATWKKQIDNHEVFKTSKRITDPALAFRLKLNRNRSFSPAVLVMTPQILLDCLRHSFFKLDIIKVLIFDECHHARGKHPYACILTEFYHRQLDLGNHSLPRIFGMTASPIKSKGANSELAYWENICKLENLMFSKVYTCVSESVLAKFIPFSTPKFKFYKHVDVQHARLAAKLEILKVEFEERLKQVDLTDAIAEDIRKKISRLHSIFMYCLDDLGVLLALKAAQILSFHENDFPSLGRMDITGQNILNDFILDATRIFEDYIGTAIEHIGLKRVIGQDSKADIEAGLLTAKVFCLFESLLEYRDVKDIRCIVFVERIIAAIVLESLLNELLPRYNGWKAKYIAGSNSSLQPQTRKRQNEIVQEFRDGKVNIIVATSILEEGLDIQTCNLVVRFDPSTTVSSFIQSRGRARMKNSDYLLMVKIGDLSTCSRLENFLASGEIMRKESIRHASVPCSRLDFKLDDDEFYCVESTKAMATLASSVRLIHLYCSCLPCDGYFKPSPRFLIDKENEKCTLLFPTSCPIQTICVQGNIKTLKQKACLEACRQLHQIGALNDNLIPDTIIEEAVAQEVGNVTYDDEQPIYFPPELVGQSSPNSEMKYCYLIQLKQNSGYEIPVHDIVLVTRSKLDLDISSLSFDLEIDGGQLMVEFKYIGQINLDPDMVHICRKFLITLFKVIKDHNLDNLEDVLSRMVSSTYSEIDYLLLPSAGSCQHHLIDWFSVYSVQFSYENSSQNHKKCPLTDTERTIQTENCLASKGMLQNSVVYTPHNGKFYCIERIFDNLDGNSLLKLRNGGCKTYKEYYKDQHGIRLRFERELLLRGRHIFPLQSYLCKSRKQKGKDSENAYVELPPEICRVVMSPISISTLYSFTFVPSIMHRLQSMLIAVNWKKMYVGHCVQNVAIPIIKILEAITTKNCQEKFHLESLETLGDSFLKYAVCQQLFKTYRNHHEGLLSFKKDNLISNATLCRLGCECKLPGFIRNEFFEPKNWMIPGNSFGNYSVIEEILTDERKIYVIGRRKLKQKVVADSVEALIGAYIDIGGDIAGLLFLDWIGIKADFSNIPFGLQLKVKPERLLNVRLLESLLNYSFRDPSLLVEALTHGSYMVPEIPRCYQRLEFLGDSVLDYLITVHLYKKYPEMSPGLLTDMRSASVNNDCYAQATVRKGLHKHILHASQKLLKDIESTVSNLENFSSLSTFGWDSEISFPKVLGDVIESLAGAIFVDSGYSKEVVFESIRPLLEPLITPETIKFHPVRELTELCQKQHFKKKKSVSCRRNGKASVTVEVEANGVIFSHTSAAEDKKAAKRIASKEVLRMLKNAINGANSSAA